MRLVYPPMASSTLGVACQLRFGPDRPNGVMAHLTGVVQLSKPSVPMRSASLPWATTISAPGGEFGDQVWVVGPNPAFTRVQEHRHRLGANPGGFVRSGFDSNHVVTGLGEQPATETGREPPDFQQPGPWGAEHSATRAGVARLRNAKSGAGSSRRGGACPRPPAVPTRPRIQARGWDRPAPLLLRRKT